MRIGSALARLLPVFAIGTLALTVGATLAVAGDTLGYDFLAYHAAAVRVLDGLPAYDLGFDLAGAFGLFFYPPTFIPLVLPFALLPATTAVAAWISLMLIAFALAVVAMPVRWRTRWLVVLLAGLSWPFVYNIKLGQVGPLLLLLFALAWRFLDRPWVVGVAAGLGAGIKVQPGILLVWVLLRRRWTALVAGLLTLVVMAGIGYLFTGPGAWVDFVSLLTRVSDPIATPQNTTIGAVAWQLGASRDEALAIQLACTILVGVAFLAAVVWLPAEASFMVAVVTTQLASPILWDHYAIVLLLPVAYLLERGHWWAVVIPLATPIVLVGAIPPVVYPLAFAVTLVALFIVGARGRDSGLYLAR